MRQIIRLTESDLHNIIKESVKQVLNEIGDTFRGQYMLGRASGRKKAQGDEKYLDIWNKAKDERAKANSSMNKYDKERAYNKGLQNQEFHDKTTDSKIKSHGKDDIRRDYKQYKSFDNLEN